MTSTPKEQGWFTRERILTLTLVIATFLALYVCYRIVEPFIPPIAFALALAVATQCPYRWLKQRLAKDSLAATVATALVFLLIIGPAVFLGTYLVQSAVENINELRAGAGISEWRSVIERQPQLAALLHWAETRFDVEAQLSRLAEAFAGQATDFLKGSVNVFTQLGITLFVLFFMYRDRSASLEALRSAVPLSRNESERMFSRVASTIRATVNGSLTVALVQSVLAGVMYALLGVPGSVIWAALTFIAALVPVFGTALIWGPITVYLALIGSWGKALILVSWGVAAIGMIDNVLYPFLVSGQLRLHTVPTFFSILGGLALFGASGLILGPMALAITIGLIDIWWCRTAEGQAAEKEVAESKVETGPPGAALQKRAAS